MKGNVDSAAHNAKTVNLSYNVHHLLMPCTALTAGPECSGVGAGCTHFKLVFADLS